MKMEILAEKRDILRSNWREVRTKRLKLKNIMIDRECSIAEIRDNREYKELKKEQKHLSRMIKHVEHKIIRAAVNGE